jgi:tRNA A-37 threonylcarbamoyl transferase component Bud32/tetratricopeptide (TPR) repeat protein
LPRRFGGYELLEEIARGGMGVVYKARQDKPARIVALKMILAGQLASQSDIDRFFAEAQAAAALDHPNIVPIFEVSEHEGQHYFTMGFVAGESLAERLARNPIPARDAATVIRDVALAAQYAHDNGVIHRDLKPANIMLDESGRVRVTDFGLAKRQTVSSDLTCTGQLLGTPSFMSPEQVVGDSEKVGPPADVYALGSTLYALLSGRPPFQAASTIDTLKQVVEREPVSPREFDAAIPRDLETIVLKCLEKAPARRYSSARELADDLDRFLSDRPIVARRASSAERVVRWCRRNSLVTALIGTAAASLVTALTILAISNAAIRREAANKDAALTTAWAAVGQMLTRVANDKLGHAPLAHPLRVALLQDALGFYEVLLASAEDPAIRQDMQEVLDKMGLLQRELGQYEEACQSFERSLTLLASLVPTDANPPALREKMAATEKALAFTWDIRPDRSSGQQAEKHFRRAIQLYQDLERDWPGRRQPVGLCLRHLAEVEYQRGPMPFSYAHPIGLRRQSRFLSKG